MLINKKYVITFSILLGFLISSNVFAKTLPFTLSISGKHFNATKNLELSDPVKESTKINFDFKKTTEIILIDMPINN